MKGTDQTTSTYLHNKFKLWSQSNHRLNQKCVYLVIQASVRCGRCRSDISDAHKCVKCWKDFFFFFFLITYTPCDAASGKFSIVVFECDLCVEQKWF